VTVFDQWFTIFDNIDDDLFDGELRVNDLEYPRVKVKITFRD
jgi:hypothetical protein